MPPRARCRGKSRSETRPPPAVILAALAFIVLSGCSSTGDFGRLADPLRTDDIRNDIVRIDPFFVAARRVVDLDRRRQASMTHIATLTPAERVNALARISENSLTITWVHNSLKQRCDSYRFALEHLAVAEPLPAAADVDRLVTELQEQIAANPVEVAAPHFAAVPVAVAARQISK